MIQVASGVGPPTQAAWVSGGTWPGAATTSWPSMGRSAPARSSAFTIDFTGPRTVPGAWLVVSWVPAGAKMRTLAVGSSLGSNEALTTVAVPARVISSFAVVYPASAAGTAMSAATEAIPAATVQIRPLICPPLGCPSFSQPAPRVIPSHAGDRRRPDPDGRRRPARDDASAGHQHRGEPQRRGRRRAARLL